MQKPYAERRVLVSLNRYWPGVAPAVTSRDVTFDEYCAGGFDSGEVAAMLVGEVHRMLEYPRRGWQAPEPVPESAVAAMRTLAAAGHAKHLIPGVPLA